MALELSFKTSKELNSLIIDVEKSYSLKLIFKKAQNITNILQEYFFNEKANEEKNEKCKEFDKIEEVQSSLSYSESKVDHETALIKNPKKEPICLSESSSSDDGSFAFEL